MNLRRSPWLAGFAGIALLLGGILAWGLLMHPVGTLALVRRTIHPPPGKYSPEDRLISYRGKIERPCPAQDDSTAVILAIGQSNAANYGSAKMTTRHPGSVVNYSDGHCYEAASPLLGPSGDGGEFLTPMADRLVSDGRYSKVVLVPLGIGGSDIARWRRGGDLNAMLVSQLAELAKHYRITEVVWHQGETDYFESTPANTYVAAFDSLLDTLRSAGIEAPIFIAIATRCEMPGTIPWTRDNTVVDGQRALLKRDGIYLGANTDMLLVSGDRRDGCHLTGTGQEKAAASFAEAIGKVRSTPRR